MKVMTFNEALAAAAGYSRRHVLLGNGFSIACRPDIFTYGRLFEQADFTALSPSAKKAFKVLNTQDFERVIKALRDAHVLAALYKGVPGSATAAMLADADGLRELLVSTIAQSHPARPADITDAEYNACQKFVAHFDTVYTLNYDLLLYWAYMHRDKHRDNGAAPSSDDGFRTPPDNLGASYVLWEPDQSHEQNMWFLHGALHVFDSGTEVQKFTWVNTGIPLIDQIRDALSRNFYPLFVAEGTSVEKVARIKHSDYLAKAYRSFCEIQGALFVFGHSLAANDEHFLKRIEKGKIAHLFVGLHDDPDSDVNKAIIRRADRMPTIRGSKRPLRASFFDSTSAKVWG